MLIGQYQTVESTLGASAFANVAPLTACGMTVTQIDQSAESLPILNNVGAFISLHFTQPVDEVVVGGSEPGEIFDVEQLDDEHLDYACGPELAKTAKLSISYDVATVDD